MVDKTKCIGCGTCIHMCPTNAISFDENGQAQIDKKKCVKCMTCVSVCPVNAITIENGD